MRPTNYASCFLTGRVVSNRCAGFYQHRANEEGAEKQSYRADGKMLIALRSTPSEGSACTYSNYRPRIRPCDPAGPMTDLLTVFLGIVIFGANTAARFRQYQDATGRVDRWGGWATYRKRFLDTRQRDLRRSVVKGNRILRGIFRRMCGFFSSARKPDCQKTTGARACTKVPMRVPGSTFVRMLHLPLAREADDARAGGATVEENRNHRIGRALGRRILAAITIDAAQHPQQ